MLLTCAVATNSREHNIATPNRPARVITSPLNLITKCNTLTTRRHTIIAVRERSD